MKKGSISTVILILIFLVGLSLLLYLTVSDYWNSLHQSQAITEYAQQVANLDDDRYEQLWQDAGNYNQTLLTKADRYELSEEEQAEYESLLNVSGNGIIGYIEVPSINCSLPIYHGTDEAVLQIAVGHIEGSSMPVGGESTHCVLSGHRVENREEAQTVRVTADAMQIEPVIVAPLVAAPMLLILLITLLVNTRKKKR